MLNLNDQAIFGARYLVPKNTGVYPNIEAVPKNLELRKELLRRLLFRFKFILYSELSSKYKSVTSLMRYLLKPL